MSGYSDRIKDFVDGSNVDEPILRYDVDFDVTGVENHIRPVLVD